MIGNNEELDNYVLKTQGTSFIRLNFMCFRGLFVFVWLLDAAFEQLGKKGTGWKYYIVPMLGLLVFNLLLALQEGTLRLEEGRLLFQEGPPRLGGIAAIIYTVGWIHANIVLCRYFSLARQRIAEIDQTQSSLQTADVILERGLLEAKVLRQTDQAISDFTKVLQLSGGDSQLLNLAGEQLFGAKRFRDAKQFFDRALETAKDESLVKQIKKNQAFAGKRLK